MLSSHFQGTPYDPYLTYGDSSMKGAYRSIGINRNDFMAMIQIRPEKREDSAVLEWIAFGSNAFNTAVPFYAEVDKTPAYVSSTTGQTLPTSVPFSILNGIRKRPFPKATRSSMSMTVFWKTKKMLENAWHSRWKPMKKLPRWCAGKQQIPWIKCCLN